MNEFPMMHVPTRYMTPEEKARAKELQELDSELWHEMLTQNPGMSMEEHDKRRAPLEEEYETLRDLTFDRELQALIDFCRERGLYDAPHYLVDIDEEYDEIIRDHASGTNRVQIVEEDENDEFPRWKQGIPEMARWMLVEKLGEFDPADVIILPLNDFPELATDYVIMPMEAAFFTRMKLTREVFEIGDTLTPNAS